MNRGFKVFIVTVLALALSLGIFGTAMAKKPNKPQKTPKPAITEIQLSLTYRAGTLLSLNSDNKYDVVSGHKYVAKAAALPTGIKEKLRWRSSKYGVANVDSRGNIHCVRPGSATITVSNKSGTVKSSIDLVVNANMISFEGNADRTVSKIYLKGKYLYIDVVIANQTAETLETAPKLNFTLKLDGKEYSDLVKSGRLRSEIAANATGIAVYKIMKVDPRTASLLGASAQCKDIV